MARAFLIQESGEFSLTLDEDKALDAAQRGAKVERVPPPREVCGCARCTAAKRGQVVTEMREQ